MSYHLAKAVALMNTNPQEAMRWVRLVAFEGHPWGVQELDGTVWLEALNGPEGAS